jgi:hypothetical protein
LPILLHFLDQPPEVDIKAIISETMIAKLKIKISASAG